MNDSAYGILMGMGAFLWILLIGILVMSIIAWCFIFKKAGIHPGKFFIPVYGQYLQYSIAESGGLFIGQIVMSGAMMTVFSIISCSTMSSYSSYSYYGSSYSSGCSGAGLGVFLIILYLIWIGVMVAIQIVFSIRLARVFGKSGGFAVGLIFLSPIFLCILAFDKSVYLGYTGGTRSIPERWTCPNCGTKNSPYSNKCESCGYEH